VISNNSDEIDKDAKLHEWFLHGGSVCYCWQCISYKNLVFVTFNDILYKAKIEPLKV